MQHFTSRRRVVVCMRASAWGASASARVRAALRRPTDRKRRPRRRPRRALRNSLTRIHTYTLFSLPVRLLSPLSQTHTARRQEIVCRVPRIPIGKFPS